MLPVVTTVIGVGTVVASAVTFNYFNQRDSYAKTRTAYIERRTTASDRTVQVMAESRTVLVERSTTHYDRTAKVAA